MNRVFRDFLKSSQLKGPVEEWGQCPVWKGVVHFSWKRVRDISINVSEAPLTLQKRLRALILDEITTYGFYTTNVNLCFFSGLHWPARLTRNSDSEQEVLLWVDKCLLDCSFYEKSFLTLFPDAERAGVEVAFQDSTYQPQPRLFPPLCWGPDLWLITKVSAASMLS